MNCYSVGRLAVRCVQEVPVERGQDSCVIGSGGAGVSARLFANCSVVKGFSSTEMNCFSAGVTVCVGRPDLFLFVVFCFFGYQILVLSCRQLISIVVGSTWS